jgi:hypothetical protein
MSEAVTTSASTTQASSQGSANQASSQTANQSGAGESQAQTAQPQGQTQANEQAQERLLAEQDLDAFIEQTINGKKERIKVRDLTKAYGLDKTANQRLQEAAQQKKQAQQLMHLMNTDFEKYCEVTGQDPNQFLKQNLAKRKEIAEEILAQEYELQQMDPSQRKAMELEEQLKQYQSRELSQKQPLIDQIKSIVPEHQLPKGLENASMEQLQGFYQAKQQEFQQGLDSLSNELLDAWQQVGLPRVKDFGQWMAQAMMEHEKRSAVHKKQTGEDLPPLQPAEAAAKVKQRFLKSTQSLFSQMDAKAIHEVLGETIIQKLRDHDIGLASQQQPGPNFNNQEMRPVQQTASESRKPLNQLEWRQKMGLA